MFYTLAIPALCIPAVGLEDGPAGVQSQDVEAQVKHLAVYNQETYRNTPADNVIIDPRTEHEIYLPSFYAAVKSGDASVMCSYAMINGNFACNDADLETSILRNEWGSPAS